MRLFTKILVAVDFSAHARAATSVAIELARRDRASITFVHVHQPLTYVLPEGVIGLSAEQMEQLWADMRRELEASKDVAVTGGVAEVDTRLLQGNPAGEIAALARSGGFDLVVTGTHGRTGIRHALIGSVAEKVVQRAPCAVLTVRAAEAI
jgi:nucleotide-binding universal stress UspA family protein